MFIKKEAVIVESNYAQGTTLVSENFTSINAANAASAAIIATEGSIIIRKDFNEDDGADTDFLRASNNPNIWEKVNHYVVRSSDLD